MNETTELVHVYVNGEDIQATPSHPFYVPKFGWTKAINLRAGDILVLSNGEYVIVEAIQHEILESPIKVYNFEVEDFHTYFVGECGVLVHNDCEYETYYRAMSEEDYNQLIATRNVQGTKETFISPTKGYSEKYDGVLVEFRVKKGTTDKLAEIGFRDEARLTRDVYSSMPKMSNRPKDAESWILHNAYFKTEKGQINIGLGVGDALKIFNDNIIDFVRV